MCLGLGGGVWVDELRCSVHDNDRAVRFDRYHGPYTLIPNPFSLKPTPSSLNHKQYGFRMMVPEVQRDRQDRVSRGQSKNVDGSTTDLGRRSEEREPPLTGPARESVPRSAPAASSPGSAVQVLGLTLWAIGVGGGGWEVRVAGFGNRR